MCAIIFLCPCGNTDTHCSSLDLILYVFLDACNNNKNDLGVDQRKLHHTMTGFRSVRASIRQQASVPTVSSASF